MHLSQGQICDGAAHCIKIFEWNGSLVAVVKLLQICQVSLIWLGASETNAIQIFLHVHYFPEFGFDDLINRKRDCCRLLLMYSTIPNYNLLALVNRNEGNGRKLVK